MKTKKDILIVHKNIGALKNSLINTIKGLHEYGLIFLYNDFKVERSIKERDTLTRITWYNHLPGRINCNNYFNSYKQYRKLVLNNEFTCMLFDGSIIRVNYTFKNSKLDSYNLHYWPCPFVISKEELDIFTIEEILESSENGKIEDLVLRSPFRFDYDKGNESSVHPSKHLHLQSPECRIPVNSLVTFDMFIRFIFYNFYKEKYLQFDFWNELKYKWKQKDNNLEYENDAFLIFQNDNTDFEYLIP